MEIHFEEKKRVSFCGYKQTKKLPFCDGSHSWT
jgi:CDGSH-type Zn-finger protein